MWERGNAGVQAQTGAGGARAVSWRGNAAVDERELGHWRLIWIYNGSRPLKPEEEEIAGGFEAWTLWGVVSGPILSDLAGAPPYGDLTGETSRGFILADSERILSPSLDTQSSLSAVWHR